jgi:hypothetical protein
VTVVANHHKYGRTMRDSNTVNFAGVATKVKRFHRNQPNVMISLRSLPEKRRKMLSILN